MLPGEWESWGSLHSVFRWKRHIHKDGIRCMIVEILPGNEEGGFVLFSIHPLFAAAYTIFVWNLLVHQIYWSTMFQNFLSSYLFISTIIAIYGSLKGKAFVYTFLVASEIVNIGCSFFHGFQEANKLVDYFLFDSQFLMYDILRTTISIVYHALCILTLTDFIRILFRCFLFIHHNGAQPPLIAFVQIHLWIAMFSSVVRCFRLPLTVLNCRSVSSRVVHFISGENRYTAQGKVGESLLDVVINSDVPLDGFGACDGTLACCTCHVILDGEHFKRVDRVNPTSEEELDLLDLAPELDDLSRLGCQVHLLKNDPEELTVTVPTLKRDARAAQ